jgi:uncharacterized protein YmfQ (DUF2313 family)
VQPQALATLMPTYERQAGRAADLLTDIFPPDSVALLPEWEAALGLPDPCAGPNPTIEQRQQQVVARFAGGGGQSIAYFTQFAAALGYPITITEFAPARFGATTFGQPFCGPQWANVWQVNQPTFVIQNAEFGHAEFGDPFRSWGSTIVQCELQRLAPAHTLVIFSYN